MNEARIGVDRRTKVGTVVVVAALHLAAIAALIAGFGVNVVVDKIKSIAAFDVLTPPPPPPQPRARTPEPHGKVARPAPEATPQPKPIPKIVVMPQLASPPAATGSASRSGAENGARGEGSGTGAGARGNGSSGGKVRRAEKIAGELKTKDFPRSGAGERDGRFIVVRYAVGTDGRARDCRVMQSSGSLEADTITCSLIERRFRYRPATDAAGNAVPDETGWKQWWWRPQ